MATDEECLQQFLLDIKCLDELSPWVSSFNIFDVLKISKVEIRHSNMLGWLLDPNENHGLGDSFLMGLIQKYFTDANINNLNIFDCLLSNTDTFSVFREWNNIDVLLVSETEQIIVAIENKVGSHEHETTGHISQLTKYRQILDKYYKNYSKILLYLSPDGEEPKEPENNFWQVITYSSVVEILNSIYQDKKKELMPEVQLLIENYMDTIKRNLIMDDKLIEICNKIYTKHRRALDLIFENREDMMLQISNICKNKLREMSKEDPNIIFEEKVCTKSYVRFQTKEMNDFLGTLPDNNGPWSTKSCGYNELALYKDDDKIGIYPGYAFGTKNVPDEMINKMISFMKVSKNKYKEKFEWQKALGLPKKLFEEADETVVEEWAEKTIKELVRKEHEYLKQITE